LSYGFEVEIAEVQFQDYGAIIKITASCEIMFPLMKNYLKNPYPISITLPS
jgi:hypothetical protein